MNRQKHGINISTKYRITETDQMGIVHHSNYIRWFEEARCDLLDYMGVGFCRSGETGDNQSDSFGGSGLSENGLLRRYGQY